MEKRTRTLIQYLIEKRDYRAAESVLNQTLEGNSEDQLFYFFKGWLEKAKGEVDASVISWRKGLQYDVNDSDLLINLGITLCERGSTEKGLRYLSRYCRLKSYEVDQICHIVEGMKRAGLYEEAIQLLTGQSAVVGSSPKIVFAMGRLYFEVGQFEPAVDCFKKSLCDPSLNGEASNLLCYIYESLYSGQALIDAIEVLVGQTRECTDLYFNLGMILNEQHDYDRAIMYLYRAVESDPADPSLKDALSEVCEDKIESVMRLSSDSLDELGWLRLMVAYLHLNDWNSAKMCLKKAKQHERNLSLEETILQLGLESTSERLAEMIKVLFKRRFSRRARSSSGAGCPSDSTRPTEDFIELPKNR